MHIDHLTRKMATNSYYYYKLWPEFAVMTRFKVRIYGLVSRDERKVCEHCFSARRGESCHRRQPKTRVFTVTLLLRP